MDIMAAILDDSIVEIVNDSNPNDTTVDDEYPDETIEQLLERATSQITSSASSVFRKPATVTAQRIQTVISPIRLAQRTEPQRAEPQADGPRTLYNAPTRDLNESDDDVIFVGIQSNLGVQNNVINLCSPDRGLAIKSAVPASKSIPPVEQERGNTVMCAVCMESSVGRQPHSTNCGHIFCGACIKEAIRITRKCPLCNKSLNQKNIFPVFI